MTQFTIALPDSAQDYINEQIASGCYATVEEVVIALILAEKKRLAKQTLNAMIREELVCGEPIAVTPEWWEQQRSRYDSGYLLSSF
jgi:Arc/MetJ-type ribon-helix-helix transcriptional regulator